MDAIIALFNHPLFEAFGAPVTVLEVFGFVTGVLTVWALTKQYLWNWYVAALNAIAFLFLFFGVGLYADAFLQLIFLSISIYGVIKWRNGGDDGKNSLRVRNNTKREALVLLPLAALGIIGVATFLRTQTDSTVYWFDAAILILSVLATYGQSKKIIESWYVWIVVDIISIPLYFYKGLTLTALLYGIFLTLCIIGAYRWNKDKKEQGAKLSSTQNSPAERILAGEENEVV